MHAIGNTNTAPAPRPSLPVPPGTAGPGGRSVRTDGRPTTTTAAAPGADATTTAGDPTVHLSHPSAPYPWDRNGDGWVDDPRTFLEHADARQAALAASERAAAAERAQEAGRTDATTTAGAAATSTRADASGRAHAAVALANATAVVSRASYAHDPPPARRSAPRRDAVAEVAQTGAASRSDVRRQYRPVHAVPAVASRYL